MEPPSTGQVERVVASACRRFDDDFAATAAGRLGPVVCGGLEDLLSRPNALAELKSDPGPLGLDTLLAETGKLSMVRALGLTEAVFGDASDRIVAAWRARAARMYPSDFAGCPSGTSNISGSQSAGSSRAASMSATCAMVSVFTPVILRSVSVIPTKIRPPCALAMDATHSARRGVAFSLKSTVSGSVPVVAVREAIRTIVTSAWAQPSRECQDVTGPSGCESFRTWR